MVAGQMERSSRRRGVTRVHKGLDDIHDDAHDPLDRPQRAPGAPSGRYLCPQTVTARRGGVRGAAALAGAARERRSRRSGGRTGSTRAPETGRSNRRAPIREAHGHIIYIPGSLRGRGRAWMGGHWGDMRGFVQFSCTQSGDRVPFDVLVPLLWPPDKRAAWELG